jgi:predicted component of type VI protein secretion system
MSFLNRFLPQQPHDDVQGSVVRNLMYLLNSRRDYGSLLGSFGLADYLAEQGGPNTILTVLHEIQQTISLYEPRLRLLSLRSLGRDTELWLHIDVQGMLLLPYRAIPCHLLILFHPISGAVEIPQPSALRVSERPTPRPPTPQLPPGMLSALSRAAEVGADALLASSPELAQLLVVAALAQRSGLLPAALTGAAIEGGSAALSAQPELALLLALIGQAAQAGLLPPALAGTAAKAGKLAIDMNYDVAELAAVAAVAAQTGVTPPGLSGATPVSGKVATEMVLLANLAAQRGLLPAAVAAAITHSPRLALTTTSELAGALGVASLVAQLVLPSTIAAEGRDGS